MFLFIFVMSNMGIMGVQVFGASEINMENSDNLSAFYEQPLKGDNEFVQAHNEFIKLVNSYENGEISEKELDANAKKISLNKVEEGYTGYKQTKLYNSSSENAQELKLCTFNATKCVKANSIAKKASSAALAYYDEYTSWQGNGDAFRHVYWNALMTKHIDRDFAYALGLAHEGLTKGYDYSKQNLDVQMDITNNFSGRKLGSALKSKSDTYIANSVNSNVKKGSYLRVRVYQSGSTCKSPNKRKNSSGGYTCTIYRGKKIATSAGGALK